MTGLHGIPGTFEFGEPNRWTDPKSPFMRFMGTHGFEGPRRQMEWSTFLDGPQPHLIWRSTACSLLDRFVSPWTEQPYLPLSDMNFIAYSFAAMPLAYACSEGLQVNNLLMLGAPMRKDMELVWRKARPNIKRIWHVYSDLDAVQTLGADPLWNERRFALANHNVQIAEVDHFFGMLHDERKFSLWEKYGLLDFLRGGPELGS